MITPVTVYPYAISIGTDNDSDANTSLTFEIRAKSETSQTYLGYNSDPYSQISLSNSTLCGKAEFNNVDENDTAWRPFFNGTYSQLGTLKINAGDIWGVYLSNVDPNNLENELVIKVYFYQA